MSSPDNERRLFESKRAHFKGSAKVPLDLLQSYASSTLTFDAKNVARLIQVFKSEGCYRLDPNHHVPATISLPIFGQALRDAGIEQHTLLTNDDPPLIRPEGVTVLHGRHRLNAAQTHLHLSEQWWVVDFYDDGLPQEVFTAIQEEYSNSRQFCDGDIYRSLRHHQLNGNQAEAGKWLARLSDSKQQDISQLHDHCGDLAEAFDSLLPIIGLWGSLELGTFHRILTCRCFEEMIHYLQHIYCIFRRILPAQYLSFVDPATVTFLETLAPKFSRRDRADVIEAMHDRKIFPQINEEPIRAQILDRILEIEVRIPSLFTFLEDTKYLEPPSKVMRVLFPPINPRSTTSISDLFSRHFSRNNTSISIQQSEQAYVSRNMAAAEREWAAYRQMFLFGWRHFPHLTDTLPRKDARKPKPTHDEKRSLRMRFELADLASRSGYDSHKIHSLLQKDPDKGMARSFLKQIRPDDLYDFNEEDRASLVEQICEEVRRRSSVVHSHDVPSFTTNEIKQPKSHRCGRPFEQDHRIDQSVLFLKNIYGNINIQVKEHLTPFAIKRDIFLAFFGHDTYGIFGNQSSPPRSPPPRPPRPSPRPPTRSLTRSPPRSSPPVAQHFPSQQPAPQLEALSPSQLLTSCSACVKSIIPGFTDDLEAQPIHTPNRANKLTNGRKVSEIIHCYLNQTDFISANHIILYLWRQQEYIYYDLSLNSSESLFNDMIRQLANEHHFFTVINTPDQVFYPSLREVWQRAQKFRIVLAGQKLSGSKHPYVGRNLHKFLSYLD